MAGPDRQPGTVLPPPRGGARAVDYATHAAPVLALAEDFARDPRPDAMAQIAQATAALDGFGRALAAAGGIPATIPPARLALALILDQRARANPRLDLRRWSAAAQGHLFDGHDLAPARLSDFIARAEAAGPDFAGVGRFLADCRDRLEGDRRQFDRDTGANWTGIVVVLVAAFALAVLGWAGFVEWRHHRDLTRAFAAEALAIGLDRPGPVADLAARLDRLDGAAARVAAEAGRAPATLFARPLGFDAQDRAEAVYHAAVMHHVPPVLATALDDAIATEGDGIALYDDLRAWAILSGSADWSASYLAGWAQDRAATIPALAGLAPHIAGMDLPAGPLPAPDPELMAQARTFAAEADEPSRAFLELRRSDAVARLRGWRADVAVPGIADILQRRSGRAMGDPVAGLYTAAGWALARDRESGLAVQVARAQAAALLDTEAGRQNDSPDQVMALLQRATLAEWQGFLADLRVRPFTDPETAILVSGRLALPESPLVALLREVWLQSGGTDRLRPHALQLRIATEFGPMIQYVEEGRMADIAALFASLNVALGAMDRDEEAGLQRLMTVQDRAASVAALRQAPLVVVQIVEDVLAQTAAAHADLMTNPLTRAWQAEVLPACRAAVEGRYPFGDGADADPAAVAALLAPGGAVDRFFLGRAENYLDTTTSPWRWKPEARFAGLSPESAALIQRARTIGEGLFGSDGSLGTPVTLAALAERGKAFIAIGGAGGPVEATSDSLALSWPGSSPAAGIEIDFQSAEGAARLAEPGPWGLLRLLDPVRLRERDEGRRFLVDLRAGDARLFLEIGFPAAANPLSRRRLMAGFTCPQVL